jgi:Fic family protein
MGTPARTYASTHPWITFCIDMGSASPRLWMLLGEARSKVEHVAGSLLKPDVAERLHLLFLAKGALATTAIEGNTLTENEVLDLIQGRLRLPPSREYLAREVENIIGGLNAIAGEVLEAGRDLTPHDIKEFNRSVLDGLELEENVVPGEVRRESVVVGRYRAAPPEDCEHLLERLCDWLSGPDFAPSHSDWRLPMAIIQAAVAHLYLAWIHSFGDGNGRTARLVEFKLLLSAGVPTPTSHLLSNHYNQTRAEYYRQLDAASASGGDVLPFVEYAVQGFVDGLREQLRLIKFQQWDDRWEQFIYESFGDAKSEADLRRRQLALDLSRSDEPVPKSRLSALSPELAVAYSDRTVKTLTRDLNALEDLGLIAREPRGYRARKEVILAFLPVSTNPPIP